MFDRRWPMSSRKFGCCVACRQHPRDKGGCSIERGRCSRGSWDVAPHVGNIRVTKGDVRSKMADVLAEVRMLRRMSATSARQRGMFDRTWPMFSRKLGCCAACRQHPRDKGGCSIEDGRCPRGSSDVASHVGNIRATKGDVRSNVADVLAEVGMLRCMSATSARQRGMFDRRWPMSSRKFGC